VHNGLPETYQSARVVGLKIDGSQHVDSQKAFDWSVLGHIVEIRLRRGDGRIVVELTRAQRHFQLANRLTVVIQVLAAIQLQRMAEVVEIVVRLRLLQLRVVNLHAVCA
jgi:hypothetical protein